jgi:hypothetical protein
MQVLKGQCTHPRSHNKYATLPRSGAFAAVFHEIGDSVFLEILVHNQPCAKEEGARYPIAKDTDAIRNALWKREEVRLRPHSLYFECSHKDIQTSSIPSLGMIRHPSEQHKLPTCLDVRLASLADLYFNGAIGLPQQQSLHTLGFLCGIRAFSAVLIQASSSARTEFICESLSLPASKLYCAVVSPRQVEDA